MSEVYRQTPETEVGPTGVSEEQMDQLAAEMERGMQRYLAQYRRMPVDDLAPFLDALEVMGLKVDDLTRAQVATLESLENSLFAQYITDDDEE